MRVFDIFDKSNMPLTIALGFFDCLHLGHRLLLDTAKDIASSCGASAGAFTFRTDPSEVLGGKCQIYDFDRRKITFEDCGADVLISADFAAIANISAEEFLNVLFDNFNIKAVVVGGDYTFGARGRGNVNLLRKFCAEKCVKLVELPFYQIDGKKLSTGNLKQYVEGGDVEVLDKYLSEPYFMTGVVAPGRRVGASIGFATANISSPSNCLPLREGIYATRVEIDGKKYDAMTNVGAKPTFGDSTPTVETHIFGFDRNLYGCFVKIAFFKRTRDIVRFGSAAALAAQLESDRQNISEYLKNLNWPCGAGF